MHRGKPADLKVLAAVGALGGIAAIAAERQRGATEYPLDYGRIKGYSAEHDDAHVNGELAAAGAAYAVPAPRRWLANSWGQMLNNLRNSLWPFGEFPESNDPEGIDTRKRELEKAGALIAAEWDRLDRIERRKAQQDGITPPAAPALEIKPEPVTSVTLRIDMPKGRDYYLTWDVRRMLLGYLARMEDARAGSHDAETFDGKALGGLPGTLTVTCNEEPDQFARQLADLSRLRPLDEWHDDDGPVLWWALRRGKIEEPPAHVGTPNDSDWPSDAYQEPEYVWYWSPIPDPSPIV